MLNTAVSLQYLWSRSIYHSFWEDH